MYLTNKLAETSLQLSALTQDFTMTELQRNQLTMRVLYRKQKPHDECKDEEKMPTALS